MQAVAVHDARQRFWCQCGQKRRHRFGHIGSAGCRQGFLRARHASHQAQAVIAAALGHGARGVKRGVGNVTALREAVPHMALTLLHQLVRVGFKQLHHIHVAAQIGVQVARHRTHTVCGNVCGGQPGTLQVVLKGHPGGGHVTGRCHAQALQISPLETPLAAATHQHKRVFGHHLGKAHQGTARVGIVVHHDPHRPAPGHIGTAVEQLQRGVGGGWRNHMVHIQAFALPIPACQCQVKGHVGHGPHVFAQNQWTAGHDFC